MKTAIYTFSSASSFHTAKSHLDIVIPKKRGVGYLKSCFGWHSRNEASAIFEDNRPEWFTTGDCTDIDGYLSIDLRLNTWDEKFNEGLEEVFKALKICFPYVDNFKEDRDLFYEILK